MHLHLLHLLLTLSFIFHFFLRHEANFRRNLQHNYSARQAPCVTENCSATGLKSYCSTGKECVFWNRIWERKTRSGRLVNLKTADRPRGGPLFQSRVYRPIWKGLPYGRRRCTLPGVTAFLGLVSHVKACSKHMERGKSKRDNLSGAICPGSSTLAPIQSRYSTTTCFS